MRNTVKYGRFFHYFQPKSVFFVMIDFYWIIQLIMYIKNSLCICWYPEPCTQEWIRHCFYPQRTWHLNNKVLQGWQEAYYQVKISMKRQSLPNAYNSSVSWWFSTILYSHFLFECLFVDISYTSALKGILFAGTNIC